MKIIKEIKVFNLSALRIHMSLETAKALASFGTFQTELRGGVDMKVCPGFVLYADYCDYLVQGKGTVTTYLGGLSGG